VQRNRKKKKITKEAKNKEQKPLNQHANIPEFNANWPFVRFLVLIRHARNDKRCGQSHPVSASYHIAW
jgi:hypothetical protein